jgi:D-alanyl-lipoteichoic acid acyltransferase DltB (MBOAT superfamily)
MLWGFFQKLVIADRAAIFVNTVYNDPAKYNHYGFVSILATVLFAFQIYCDFASYSDIARGAAEVMGFSLMKNFNTPYFSQSVAEFWRRWHISLSTWFRDYLYIPLGGNRKGTLRKYINLMIVFCVSGLWHGASWNFVIWGALNGFYQVFGVLTKPTRRKYSGNTEVFSTRLGRMLITFALICFSWIFFRANTLTDAITIVKGMLHLNPWVFTDGTLLTCGLDWANWCILAASLLVLLVVSTAKYNGIEIRRWFFDQGLWLQYLIILCAVFTVLIFGIYGSNYNASQFIYFQF